MKRAFITVFLFGAALFGATQMASAHPGHGGGHGHVHMHSHNHGASDHLPQQLCLSVLLQQLLLPTAADYPWRPFTRSSRSRPQSSP